MITTDDDDDDGYLSELYPGLHVLGKLLGHLPGQKRYLTELHTCPISQACIFNTPTASVTMLQSDECWVSLWRIMAFPHIYDVSHSKLHELGQN